MFSVIDNVAIGGEHELVNAASLTVAVFDYILCLPQEVDLVWPTQWNVGKILYFLTRYSAFLDSTMIMYFAFPTHSELLCQRVFKVSSWFTISGIIISEVVLVFRTWAVWGCNSRIFIILLCILLTGTILSIIFARISFEHVEFGSPEQGYPPGCWFVKIVNPIIIFGYIIILSFEIIILGLTLYKFREAVKTGKSKLLVTLHRDAILCCFFIVAWSVINIATNVISVHFQVPSLGGMQRVIHSVLTARILLNLRQAVRANQPKSSLGNTSLHWEVAPRGHGTAENGVRSKRRAEARPRQSHIAYSDRHAVRHHLSTILRIDSETEWTHDEEIARRMEIEDEERYIEMPTLSTQEPGTTRLRVPNKSALDFTE